MNIAPRPPIVFSRGSGSWLYCEDGRAFLDFEQGWAVNCLGHSAPLIALTLRDQAARLTMPSAGLHNAQSLALAQALVAATCFDQAFFCSSGAEANEGAIKLARKFGALKRGGAHEIVTFDGAFHGRTLAAMSASGKPAFATLFEPKVTGFPKARLNDLASVERLVGPQTVAIMVEPIQGEAGVRACSPDFLRGLRALCDAHGLLLIFDEIQTGVGRTGALFDYMNAGVEPDVMTIGKGIGGGVPLAGLLAKQHASVFEHGDQGGTYCGNPLMCAVGLAVLRAVNRPDFLAHTRRAGAYLTERLEALARKHGFGAVEGRGLLLALDLQRETAFAMKARAFDAGLLINAPCADRLRFMPALNVSLRDIDLMIDRLDACV